MPKPVDDCVNAVLKNPNFKPMKGRTKEESAWAICYANYNERKQLEKQNKKK